MLSVVDLFCGAGGISEGFRQQGYRVLAGVDADPDAAATYAQNFPEAKAIWGDLRRPRTRAEILEWAARADVLVGGPPCQAFSQVRNFTRLIEDPRNSLYRQFVKIVRDTRPPAFLMENVPGLRQMGVEDQVVEDLTLDGAYVVSSAVLDAADFGVPQTRKRIVFLGLRADLGAVPPRLRGAKATERMSLRRVGSNGASRYLVAADRGGDDVRWRLFDPETVALVTVKQAIGDLEWLKAGDRSDSAPASRLSHATSAYQRLLRQDLGRTVHNVSVPRINEDTVRRLRVIAPGGNYRDLPPSLLRRHLSGQRWGPTNGTGRLGRVHYYAYRRLNADYWSWTLNTKADSVYHYRELRALSVREFARLQSFPDRFVFVTAPQRGSLPGRIAGGAAHSRYRQVGNAVPPLFAKAIAAALRKALGKAAALVP